MKFNKLFFSLVFTLLCVVQVLADPPLPPPPIDPGDGTGGTGPGGTSSPIDMYIYILALVGLIFIIYFTKKRQKNLA